MKAAFFHDAPLVQARNGQVYSTGFAHNIWERYLAVFDYIIVSTRLQIDNSIDGILTKNMKLSSRPRVEFKPINEYAKKLDALMNRKKIRAQIGETLEQCDYAIIRLPSLIGGIACREAHEMEKPYLIELVGCPWDALWNHSFKGKLVAPFMYYATKKRVRDASHVVYVTNEFLQRRYPTTGKNVTCPNVALRDFDDGIHANRLAKIQQLYEHDKLVIGTAAAVDVRYKGQQYVIQALGNLKKRGITRFEYQLVGGGDQRYLKKIAEKQNVQDQVKMLGRMPHDKVFEWLDGIDIYVQPSMQEGLPRALIEAMSRALPCIGSNVGGIPELLDQNFVFRRGSVDEICTLLKKMDKATILQEAKKNNEKAKEYDSSLIEKRRTEFFEAFVKGVKKTND